MRTLKTLATLALSAALALPAAAQDDTLKAMVMLPSPEGDVGWSFTMIESLRRVQAEYGDAMDLTVITPIPEGPDADRIMNNAVADGNEFLVLGSFGYMNGGIQLAKRNPDIDILHASGYLTEDNFAPFAAKYWQGTYLMGMAAASLTESKKLGVVGAFAIPELITSINAFALGAREVDPEIEVSVVWVNSWFDPAAEQDAARALLSQGVDVLFSNAQDTPSVVSLAEEEGAYVFNLNSSMKAYAPSRYLGVVGTDWSPWFAEKIAGHLDGTFEGEFAWLGFGDDVLFMADYSADIPDDVAALIAEREAAIRSGDFDVFGGPLVDQSGTERVASGASMSDPEILGMDWHVEGVTTPLPN
ncbi:BMP family ABC transporter substrate-binding protein [Jannaschia sp. LMIT008]|uniref:BMP family ABC transporter substrate-binding protein n=1 Tax=Jannaschia maritima TaxID=3032585 RepID=UPI002811F8C7|nr:BMP family ABC transporter substrate-binding protein [Jannaschia sp. LMIT008]